MLVQETLFGAAFIGCASGCVAGDQAGGQPGTVVLDRRVFGVWRIGDLR
jgi:hypothetical protein